MAETGYVMYNCSKHTVTVFLYSVNELNDCIAILKVLNWCNHSWSFILVIYTARRKCVSAGLSKDSDVIAGACTWLLFKPLYKFKLRVFLA